MGPTMIAKMYVVIRKDLAGVHHLHCPTTYADSSGEASQNDIMIYIYIYVCISYWKVEIFSQRC